MILFIVCLSVFCLIASKSVVLAVAAYESGQYVEFEWLATFAVVCVVILALAVVVG